MRMLSPLSSVANTGFNFYLTNLYGKQHNVFAYREPFYLDHIFLFLTGFRQFDCYCRNCMTSSEVNCIK